MDLRGFNDHGDTCATLLHAVERCAMLAGACVVAAAGRVTRCCERSVAPQESCARSAPSPVDMPAAEVKFSSTLAPSDPRVSPVLILGQLHNLQKVAYDGLKTKLQSRVTEEHFNTALASLHPTPTDTVSLHLNVAYLSALPAKCSRHNTPSRSHAIAKIVKNTAPNVDQFIVMVCESSDVLASACAVGRAFPLYSRKGKAATCSTSGVPLSTFTVTVEFLLVDEDSGCALSPEDLQCLTDIVFGVRLAAKIVDTPCSEMHVDAFLKQIDAVGELLDIKPYIIRGQELEKRGFGGLWCVGKAAERLPALAVISHTPEGAKQTIAWVGKGIVFDTGGLSMKSKTSMVGMKQDCGGAAGILGAFYAIVKQGFRENLHAVFCLAENAVGPNATRPDDIVTLYSGRTVEINNTDAEGRLVVGDGVAYAQKDLQANVILDMCTLTGAQGIATGKFHAGLVTNSDEWDSACVKAGKSSGDLVHPLPYCPELHFCEFSSTLADMKNSASDRCNALASCAALFIAAQIGFDFPGSWIHVDMASPVSSGERATGYGVALLAALFGHSSNSALLQKLSPFTAENGVAEENACKKMRLA